MVLVWALSLSTVIMAGENPAKLRAIAEQALETGDIYSAIDYYKRYCDMKPSDYEASYKLGNLYLRSRNYSGAQEWFLSSYQASKNEFVDALFQYAFALKHLGKYELSLEHFHQFRKKAPKDHWLRDRLQIEIQGCELAKEIVNLYDMDQKVKITHLSAVNRAHYEGAPTLIDENTMMYSSLRVDSIQFYKNEEERPKRKIYTAERKKGQWSGETEVEVFSDFEAHSGNTAISPDGERIYLSKCKRNIEGNFVCDLYQSKKIAGEWITPIKLSGTVNDPNTTSTQPAVRKIDENTEMIYFVSNRSGGNGGLDIWSTQYSISSGEFTDPVNLGDEINTKWDEITPFYHHDSKKLYFSSNGWPSIGGFDIYQSNEKDGEWLHPISVDHPVNSEFDEMYYRLSEENDHEGYFVSNRDGTVPLKNKNCCDDIFQLNWLDQMQITVNGKLYDASYIERMLESDDGSVVDEDETKYLISNQKVVLYQFSSDDQPIPVDSTLTNDQGEYEINVNHDRSYKIVIERDGYFNKHHVFNTKNVKGNKMNQHIGLLEITADPIVVKNIYYPFDEWYLTESAQTTIDSTIYKVLTENPKLIIEISAHTDNHGSADYNQKLSQKRAESVVNYLIKHDHISPNRLKARGYGESRPIADNNLPDGTDYPDGRAKNRRTEFKVVGSVDGKNPIIYGDN
ncbi:MAG: OmpA family protein [Flavobacteriales bacterium]|nr:OmpA family protein [Flavobacteriales bacterium]